MFNSSDRAMSLWKRWQLIKQHMREITSRVGDLLRVWLVNPMCARVSGLGRNGKMTTGQNVRNVASRVGWSGKCHLNIQLMSRLFGWCVLLWGNVAKTACQVNGHAVDSKENITEIAKRTLGFLQEPARLRKHQEADADIAPVSQWIESGVRPSGKSIASLSPATRHYWCQWDSLMIIEGVLYRQFWRKDGLSSFNQFVVPKSLRDEILLQMHSNIVSGHLGRRKTQEKVFQRFYWFEIREDIALWLTKCDKCEEVKIPPRRPKAGRMTLGRMPTGALWHRLGTDILGPLPLTQRHNQYILGVTDYFTKWVEIFAIPALEEIKPVPRVGHLDDGPLAALLGVQSAVEESRPAPPVDHPIDGSPATISGVQQNTEEPVLASLVSHPMDDPLAVFPEVQHITVPEIIVVQDPTPPRATYVPPLIDRAVRPRLRLAEAPRRGNSALRGPQA